MELNLSSLLPIINFRIYVLTLWIIIGCFLLCNTFPVERKVDYSGHMVLRLYPTKESDYHIIWDLSQREYLDMEIWGETVYNTSVDVRVSPNVFPYITECFDHYKIGWIIEINDLQSLIDGQMVRRRSRTRRSTDEVTEEEIDPVLAQQRRIRKRRRRAQRRRNKLRRRRRAFQGRFTVVGQYARYRQLRLWMKTLTDTYPNLATVVEIGRTYENRPLELIKIGSSRLSGGRNKSAIWIDGGIHAREWIAPATVAYIIERLLLEYGKDQDTTRLVDTFDWYLLPVANPDGYEYSHVVDRLWRKTRSRPKLNGYNRCEGVDMNRNFEFQWKGHCDKKWMFLCGSSNPCQGTYAGEHPFSEPEVISMRDTILAHREQIKMYLSLHAYSQMWLTPWGYTDHPPHDMRDLMVLARKGMNALKTKYGTHYVAGSPATILYPAGGGSFDWAKAVAGIKYSYTLELRDTGRYGFLLPRHYILPVGEETWHAIKAVASELLGK